MAIEIIDDNVQVLVENMSDHGIGYVLVGSGIQRRLAPHAHMMVKAGELRELSYQHGGLVLLQNFLRVTDKKLAEEFGVTEDMVEYWWTEDDIIAALTTKPIEYLLDALDFGPEAIVENLKYRAIELEIQDGNRLSAIKARTGADIPSIIRNKHAYEDAEKDEQSNSSNVTKRRVGNSENARAGRRVQS